MTPRISAERLLADLEALARIGGRSDGGVDRVAGSEADLEARRWLLDRVREAGLEPRMDDAGNVFGRSPGAAGPWMLVGSHTDTVPAGGRLDGAYGVIAALEVLRALDEAGHPAAREVEVVSFFDEEGVGAGGGMKGSTALCADAHIRELIGYLEIHIEQGPRLEAAGIEVGLVEGIVGIDRWDVVIKGSANHAGTTPMAMRRDAGAAAGRVLATLPAIVSAVDSDMVANIGRLDLLPGAPNVVPGEARFVVELRALRAASLRAAGAAVSDAVATAAASHRCEHLVEPHSSMPPVRMSPTMVAAIERVCARLGRTSTRLVSGAGHDAGALARELPVGLMFVPSRGGISHSPDEYTEPAQLVAGAEVLLHATLETVGISKA